MTKDSKIDYPVLPQKWNSDSHFILYSKINSVLIIDLDVKPKAIKLIEVTGENLCDFELGKYFLDTAPKV